MWDLPGPGIKPVSPALAVGFFTTVPPGKSEGTLFRFPLCVGNLLIATVIVRLVLLLFCLTYEGPEAQGG